MRLVSFILFSVIALASSAPSAFAAENRTSKPQQRNLPRERGLPGLPSRRQRAVERVFKQPAVVELLQSLYWQLETWISPRRRQLLNSSPSSRSVRAGEGTGPKQIFCCPRHCVGQLLRASPVGRRGLIGESAKVVLPAL
jgi:hypothetical protein